jgi:hypothetical protein
VPKPDGVVAITTNLQGHMREFYDVFDAVLGELGFDGARGDLQRHVEHRATVEGVRSLFAGAGLAVTRVERRDLPMRFADGTALLNHHFIKLGFLDAWKAIVPEHDRRRVFAALEAALNERARESGSLALTIPLAYVEGRGAGAED